MIYEVAKEVLSYCNKCKLKLAHIIVTLKNPETIHKVKCKTCQGLHAFKDDDQKKSTVGEIIKRTRSTQAKPELSEKETWEAMVMPKEKDAKNYTVTTRFFPKDVIRHVKFGLGSVKSLVDDTKIEVLFRDGVKVLVHNRT